MKLNVKIVSLIIASAVCAGFAAPAVVNRNVDYYNVLFSGFGAGGYSATTPDLLEIGGCRFQIKGVVFEDLVAGGLVNVGGFTPNNVRAKVTRKNGEVIYIDRLGNLFLDGDVISIDKEKFSRSLKKVSGSSCPRKAGG